MIVQNGKDKYTLTVIVLDSIGTGKINVVIFLAAKALLFPLIK
jgi:hypothetical protein